MYGLSLVGVVYNCTTLFLHTDKIQAKLPAISLNPPDLHMLSSKPLHNFHLCTLTQTFVVETSSEPSS